MNHWGVRGVFFCLLISFCGAAGATEGDLDLTFNKTGAVLTSEPGIKNVTNMAIQRDGKIVVVGSTDSDVVVFRYNTDGTPDAGFGLNGVVRRDATGHGWIDSGNAIAVQSDGKIVVGGKTAERNGLGIGAFLLLRYNSDGSPDLSFGASGSVIQEIGAESSDSIFALAVEANGKIVVSGTAVGQEAYNFALARFNSDGSRDLTFGNQGIINSNLGDPGSYNINSSLLLQPDGKILTSGMHFGYTWSSGLTVARYHSDGSPDLSFGTDGIRFIPIQNLGYWNNQVKSALQSDGSILLVAASGDENQETANLVVVRLTSSGTLDANFGTSGMTSVDLGNQGYDYGLGIAVQEDRKILVSGINVNDTGVDSALIRLTDTGTLDTSFSNNGIVLLDGSRDQGWDMGVAVAVQSDGRILLLSQASPMDSLQANVLLTRFQGPTANLSISQTVESSGQMQSGETLTFNAEIYNEGPNTAAAVNVSTEFPESVSTLSLSASQGTCDLSGRTCSLGELSSGSKATITVIARPEQPGEISHTISVTGLGSFDVSLGDNLNSLDLNIGNAPESGGETESPVVNLSVLQTVEPSAQIEIGKNFTFIADVRNSGPDTATAVNFSSDLPTNFTLVSINPSQGTCDLDNRSCSLGNLSAGGNATVTLVARAEQTGNFSHIITVNDSESLDPDPSDNSSFIDVTVIDRTTNSDSEGETGRDDHQIGTDHPVDETTEEQPEFPIITDGIGSNFEGSGCSLQKVEGISTSHFLQSYGALLLPLFSFFFYQSVMGRRKEEK